MTPDPTAIDALCVGETMMLLRATGPVALGAPMHTSIAGAESNVAIALARLGHRSSWCGVLGADQAGALIERTLTAESVDVGHLRRDDQSFTGILVREDRLPHLTRVDYHRRGSAGSRLDIDDVRRALEAGPVRIVHVTGITAALSDRTAKAVTWLVHQAREAGARVSLDVNHRRRLWSDADTRAALRPLLPHVDILVGSADELDLVAATGTGTGSGDAAPDIERTARGLLDEGCGEVVLKRGAAGASVFTTHGRVDMPARRVTAVDAVGAGDAFTAGYLSGCLDDLDLTGRLDRGVVLGAFAVASPGDWEGLPTRDELALLDLAAGEALR